MIKTDFVQVASKEACAHKIPPNYTNFSPAVLYNWEITDLTGNANKTGLFGVLSLLCYAWGYSLLGVEPLCVGKVFGILKGV